MNKVKIGICGLNRGRIHLMNLLINDKYEVVAICDNDKKVADDIYLIVMISTDQHLLTIFVNNIYLIV